MGSRKRPAGTQKQKKGTFKSKKTTSQTMATMTKPELKAYDIANNYIDFINTGQYEILNVPIKGDDRYERNGRNIRMKSIQIRAAIIREAAVVTDISPDFLRYIVVYDKQSNGAPPAMADFLRDATAGAQSNNFSFINLDNRDRFEILRDVSFPTNIVPAAAVQSTLVFDPTKPTYNVDLYIPLKGKEVMFNSNNAGTSADIQTGALYIFCANFVTGNNNKYQMQYTSRLRYYDV